ncbi:MAG: Ig-like domain-containing protein [Ruminococcus sp.]
MKKTVSVIISLVLLLSSVLCVNSAEIGGVTSDYYEPINSWRYHNGVPVSSFALGASSNSWKKTDEGYLNNKGEVIAGATMKGIDVSEWNGDIDWAKVAASDVDYAIIRCGYGDDYEYQDDTYFKKNVEGCIKNKIPFGVYIYSYALNTTMAKSEANHVLRLIKGYKLSFPVYYDLEDNSQLALSKTALGNIATTFCNAITAQGYQVGIYANLNWWTNYLTASAFNNTSWYKWVAQYNSYCDYTKKYTMWQCCSDGKVSGISGNVDINFWYASPRKYTYVATVNGVTLNRTSYTFKRSTTNLTVNLKATVRNDVDDKTVTWSSNNTSIATVDATGKVTAKKKGVCYITATANDGSKKYARCKITVQQLVTKVKLNKKNISLSKKGKTYNLKATCTPTTANSRAVKWKTSKKTVATVNSKGKVTAKKKGTCYITATAKDGSKVAAKCKVKVKK